LITVDDGDRLDALEVAFLQTVAIVLHDVEHSTLRAGAFRRQATAGKPVPELIDLVGGPHIEGFEMPIDWCGPSVTGIICTRFDEAGYPAELLYSAGGPRGYGKPVRIDRQPSSEYIVTRT
jgi:hypothetical protein